MNPSAERDPAPRIDVEQIMASLKGFQRRSVDYVFYRLYGPNPTRRFLLADEVGLGKTLVARGVIAKAVKHLMEEGVDRIDVIYICSNADIARQNINRLNITGSDDFKFSTRITLLPQKLKDLKKTLNFVSFTPGTSFKMGKSPGHSDERILLYWLLEGVWPDLFESSAATNVLQGTMGRDNFRYWLNHDNPKGSFDPELAQKFRDDVINADLKLKQGGHPTYRDRFNELCECFHWSRKHVPVDENQRRNRFIGEMRMLLATSCIHALEPDLVILDEFQRFKDLLNPDESNEASILASRLFQWQNSVRVLLLSATPYKMYTLSQESGSDDHYRDFIETLRFLYDDDVRTEQVQSLLTGYGQAAARAGLEPPDRLISAKRAVETALRQVICRTERLAVTEDRSGMLHDAGKTSLCLRPEHLKSYREIRGIAAAVGHQDPLEYWKASPYLLNFMEQESYKLKERLENQCGDDAAPAIEAVHNSRHCLIRREDWSRYEEISACHPMMECLLRETVGSGWWRLLWVPPSFPCYHLAGPFSDTGETRNLTKRLVFSSWHMVPRAIAIMLSYEAERQIMTRSNPEARNVPDTTERKRRLLRFSLSDGRLAGMPVWAMVYPCLSLAEVGQRQLAYRGSELDTAPTLVDLLQSTAAEIRELLQPVLPQRPAEDDIDEEWYWMAPILLDRHRFSRETEDYFVGVTTLIEEKSEDPEDGSGWEKHVERARQVAMGGHPPMGQPPADLAEVLALLAIAGPANCALRSLTATVDPNLITNTEVRQQAAKIAWGLRSLFNTPEATTLIFEKDHAKTYWRSVLNYCASGCLQSVLDEYLHILLEAEGLIGKDPVEAVKRLAEVTAEASSMRAATPGLDWIEKDDSGRLKIDNQRVRSRFAMRFGDEQGDRKGAEVRKENVRQAFNSPFWPFVLATTSIGQEGLDFHPYCHAVMHWNLPNNPVDLEQREGRVHRYKGHAVRKNVARRAQLDHLAVPAGTNPWRELFRHACEGVPEQFADIKPYWVYPIDGGAMIERHVPTLPLSREAIRWPALRRSLAVYRMVFGQPRQEDLLAHLQRTVPSERLASLSTELSVNLEPPILSEDEPPPAGGTALTE